MITHELQQGSKEWHDFRARHLTASDAPAMMGVSPYKSRTELLREKATGIAAEVDDATQRRFDDGHRFEALARPLAEKIIGQELYPAVGSEGKYAASFDGITMLEDVCFEHKTANGDILSRGSAAMLPEMYRIQMEQQLLVSGAGKCLFMATRWDSDGNLIGEPFHVWYEPDMELRKRIIAGWEQFERDLNEYQHREIAEKLNAEAIMELPALFVQVKGEVTASNLREFKEAAGTFIAAIKTDLQTDSDFANAEGTVKFCKKAEDNLDAAKKAALAQTASIDELMRTVDHIQAQLREKRLLLDKLVKTEKDKRKAEMVAAANTAYADHVAGLQAEVAGTRINLLMKTPDFGGAIKGLKSLASMHDALDTALANGKIEADAVSKDVRDKLAWMNEYWFANGGNYKYLFDGVLQQIIGMDRDAFEAVVKNRITEHKAAESAKLEEQRKRMEAEATAKAEREAAAKMAEEEARIRAEEQAKARAEAVTLTNREQHASAEFIQAEPVRPSPFARSVSRSIDKALEAGIIMPTGAHVIEHEQASSVMPVKPKPSRIELVNCIAERFGVSAYVANDWLTEEFGRQ